MSDSVSSRHEGDLGGILFPFGDGNPEDVTIFVLPEYATLPSGQHTAWMLVNLLSRLKGVVRSIGIQCPSGVRLSGKVVPLAPRDTDLRTALLAGASAIGVVPAQENALYERVLVVGAGSGVPDAKNWHVYGNGWCGGMSETQIEPSRTGAASALPFGPYVAACLAAGELYKHVRMRPEHLVPTPSAFYSVWNHRALPVFDACGPTGVDVAIDAALAGVGAVGSAFIHTLWACSGIRGNLLIADNDRKGLEKTNLNRYALFGAASVEKAKATEAARIASDAGIRWQPYDSGIEDIPELPDRVVSAVDRNTSRGAIQNRYPARILSGSTYDLRAEVLRCGPPGIGACLRCFNVPEKVVPDVEIRETLQNATETRLKEIASEANITVEEAKEWANTGHCGVPGERLLPLLRTGNGERAFAVGFVSVMAGMMLAAEFIKDHLDFFGPLSATAQRAVFQFRSPLARTNRASQYNRDPNCPMCDPRTIACKVWGERYDQLVPKKT